MFCFGALIKMPSPPRAQRFCFTLNNYTEDEEQQLADFAESDECTYLVYGRETGENGTPHLQGFVICERRFLISALKTKPGFARCHLEVSRGTNIQAVTYCKKDGDVEEYGEMPLAAEKNRAGSRNDVQECVEWLEGFIEEEHRAPTEQEVALLMPVALLRYSNFMRLVALRAPPPVLQQGEVRDWQVELDEILCSPCEDDRKVHFYIDGAGGKGKSWFCRWFLTKHPEICQMMHPAGYADMAFALDASKRVFLFNVSRTGMEYLQYRFLEDLKDRMVFSTKYNSTMKILDHVPHVVVFSNERPDMSKMSFDRYDIKDLSRI